MQPEFNDVDLEINRDDPRAVHFQMDLICAFFFYISSLAKLGKFPAASGKHFVPSEEYSKLVTKTTYSPVAKKKKGKVKKNHKGKMGSLCGDQGREKNAFCDILRNILRNAVLAGILREFIFPGNKPQWMK